MAGDWFWVDWLRLRLFFFRHDWNWFVIIEIDQELHISWLIRGLVSFWLPIALWESGGCPLALRRVPLS